MKALARVASKRVGTRCKVSDVKPARAQPSALLEALSRTEKLLAEKLEARELTLRTAEVAAAAMDVVATVVVAAEMAVEVAAVVALAALANGKALRGGRTLKAEVFWSKKM